MGSSQTPKGFLASLARNQEDVATIATPSPTRLRRLPTMMGLEELSDLKEEIK
jgi:hypothetical protein